MQTFLEKELRPSLAETNDRHTKKVKYERIRVEVEMMQSWIRKGKI